jgi:hypothetical protein
MSEAKPQLNPPGKETVYVDVEDEITAIIDKVEASKSKIVVLMLPKRATHLQSVVNMRLLKRAADNAKKSLVLVTSEAALLPLAGVAGLHVAKDLKSAPAIPDSPISEAAEVEAPIDTDTAEGEAETPAKLDYKRSIGELAAAHDTDEAISIGDDEDLPTPTAPKTAAEKAKSKQKLKVPNFERFRLLLFGGIAALIALIIFIFMAIFVLPKAVIAIHTASTPISANLTLNASDKYTALNQSANQIPASLKATKQSSNQQVNATGRQNQGDKATGIVTVSTVCTKVPSSVDAGTGMSSNGLTYVTTDDLKFKVSGSDSNGNIICSGDVPVKASQGGSQYNLSSGSTFKMSNSQGYTGKNSSALTGGTDNNVTVVSQQDVDNARTKATSGQNADDFTKQFLKQLDQQGFYVLKSTLKTEDPVINASPGVGQPASTVNVSVQVTYTILVVPKTDLKEVITNTLKEQIDEAKQKINSEDVLKDASVTVQSQTGPAAATLNVSETTDAVPIINVATVKKQVAGQKTGNIKAMLANYPGVKSVDVKLSPFWVSKVPKKQSKITIKLIPVKE